MMQHRINTLRRGGRRGLLGGRNGGRSPADRHEGERGRRQLLALFAQREVELTELEPSNVNETCDDEYDDNNPCTDNFFNEDGNDCTGDFCNGATDDYCDSTDDSDSAWDLMVMASAQPNHQSNWGWGKHRSTAREAAPIRRRPSPLYHAIHVSGDPDDIHFAYADR